MADDMPALSDARRVVRLAMVLDELRKTAKHYRNGEFDKVRDTIDDVEFFICGGRRIKGKKYSFRRQLVYTKRDAHHYASRMVFPDGKSVRKALKLYEFYESDGEDLDDDSRMTSKDSNRVHRMVFVLRAFRRLIRSHPLLSCKEAMKAFLDLKLDYDDFVCCGGHKSTSKKKKHSFYKQVVLAKRDMQEIMRRGRFNKAKEGSMPGYISSDQEEEEDVDQLDFDEHGDQEGECVDNEDEMDDVDGEEDAEDDDEALAMLEDRSPDA